MKKEAINQSVSTCLLGVFCFLILVLSSTSCTSQSYSVNNSTVTPFVSPTEIDSTPTIIPPSSTVVSAVETPVASSTVNLDPNQPGTATLVHSPTPNAEHPLGGLLYGVDSNGIWQISIPEGTNSYILEKESDWLSWSASVSSLGKWAVYWFKTESDSEIWLSPLANWQPTRLMKLPEYDYELIGFGMFSNDKYLIVVLGKEIEDEVFIPVWYYLIDTESKQVLYEQSGYANSATDAKRTESCRILALSPRTEQLSIWCPVVEEQNLPLSYAVLEMDGQLWYAEELLKGNIIDSGTGWGNLAWSPDGTYFAYSLYTSDDGINRYHYLFFSNTDHFEPVLLPDDSAISYSEVRFSPDNKLIAYSSYEGNLDFCATVISLNSREVVWKQQKALCNTLNLAWSPDGNYLAIVSSDNLLLIWSKLQNDIILQNIQVSENDIVGRVVWAIDD